MGGGERLPYLGEYLLCEHFHWSWRQVQETPANVLAFWSTYRNIRVRVENAAREE